MCPTQLLAVNGIVVCMSCWRDLSTWEQAGVAGKFGETCLYIAVLYLEISSKGARLRFQEIRGAFKI